MDCIVQGVTKSQIQLSHFHFTFKFLGISSLTHMLFRNVLFNLHVFWDFPGYFLGKKKLLISSLIQCLRPDTEFFCSLKSVKLCSMPQNVACLGKCSM